MLLFLSLPSPLSPNSSPFSFSHIRISSSLLPNHNNNNKDTNPIPKVHSDGNVAIKAPTPPWMKGPILLQLHDLLHFSNPKRFNKGLDKVEKHEHEHEPTDNDKAKVVRGKKVMKKIVQIVEKLHRTQNLAETQMGSAKVENFGGCLESLKENEEVRSRERMPWEKDESVVSLRMKKEKAFIAADLTLDKVLLRRLRDEAATMRNWVKVKKAGFTQVVVDEIKRTWEKKNELAMVKFDIPLCLNMDRAREIIETKTGGLVVWSKKDAIVVYPECNHQLTSKGSPEIYTGYIHSQRNHLHK
ncbi:chloroplastic group IIA intron splicing facilitator CRS1, chloroplastic-like [Gastrolobium bilobum]|uniref:chloroplastic group IIA intron splicing facilitator CRS1, chloroplastic-like n=1 Tax=Gastrolobium bilobum TaxID=150636 RepID=UPI002AB2DFD5|nr:chloroplastic group IIA intron splicing facilitator CRS1, chloroplastic-like [Gastrolobium bilobum]